MLEPILKDGLHLSCTFVIKERMQAFVDEFFDQAGTFGQGDEVIFLLISQGCHKRSWSQICSCEAILDEGGSDWLKVWLGSSDDGPVASLLLKPAGVGLPGGIVFRIA